MLGRYRQQAGSYRGLCSDLKKAALMQGNPAISRFFHILSG